MKYKEFTKLCPKEDALVDVDWCILNDNLSLRTLEDIRAKQAFNNKKVVIVIDQLVPPHTPEQSSIQRQLMRLSEEQSIPIYFGQAMTSSYLCDGRVKEGQIVAAVNPTVVVAGIVGGYSIAVREEDIAEVFEKGQVEIKSYRKIFVKLSGKMPGNLTSKDLAFAIMRQIDSIIQYNDMLCIYGDALDIVDMNDKINISVLLMNAGAGNVVYDVQDPDIKPSLTIELDNVQQMIAINNSYHDIVNLSEWSSKNINVVFIGGSTGGSFKDIKKVADSIRGKQIANGIRLIVTPSASETYIEIANAGFIQDILDAGGIVLNQCSDPEIQCRIGRNEIMISNDWKNIAGYAAYDDTSQIIIASTDIAVIAALTGSVGNNLFDGDNPQTSFVLEGRCWKFGDDIDTDIIIPTQYVTFDYDEMLKHAFEPLRPEIAALFQVGDIIIAGNNFGCGSSREMAAEVIAGNGIRCIIAKSFARIFFRNAINNGIFLIECPALPDDVEEGNTVRVELNNQIIYNGKSYPIGKIKKNLYEIIIDGGLVKNIEKKVKSGLL